MKIRLTDQEVEMLLNAHPVFPAKGNQPNWNQVWDGLMLRVKQLNYSPVVIPPHAKREDKNVQG
jgi:hypothetical protein